MTFILTDLSSFASLRVMFFLQACTFLTLMTEHSLHEDRRFYQAGVLGKDKMDTFLMLILFCAVTNSSLLWPKNQRKGQNLFLIFKIKQIRKLNCCISCAQTITINLSTAVCPSYCESALMFHHTQRTKQTGNRQEEVLFLFFRKL